MANFTASTVGLYNAGGSGDNLAPNNTIKGIEKVWVDSFTFSAVLTTADTILIGYVPANCRIVGVEAVLPSTWAPQTANINIGMSYSTALLVSNATLSFSAPTAGTVLFNKVTLNNVNGQNFNPTSSTSVVSGGTILTNTIQGVYMSLTAAITAPTAGTIQTIIRYV